MWISVILTPVLMVLAVLTYLGITTVHVGKISKAKIARRQGIGAQGLHVKVSAFSAYQ